MDLIVDALPFFNLSLCVLQISKHVLVQTLIPKPRVERLNEGVLIWLTRSDEFMLDLGHLHLDQH